MALEGRFRSGGAREIARFLADHQHCDSGFDVRRDEVGSGRLRITCLGCGATVDYRAAEAGQLATGLPVGLSDNGDAGGSELGGSVAETGQTPPAEEDPLDLRPTRAGRAPRRSRFPDWAWLAVIGALIIGGLTMVVIGTLRDDGEQAQAPTEPTSEAVGEQAQAVPGQSEPGPPAAGGGSAADAEKVPLTRRRFAGRFTIGIPPGWDQGVKGRALAIIAPGGTAELEVFFEPGGRPELQLARAAEDFLARRHERGRIGKARAVRVGSRRGLRVGITYPGGDEVALVMAAKGFSYLLLRRVNSGASAGIRRQAEAALASFRPH